MADSDDKKQEESETTESSETDAETSEESRPEDAEKAEEGSDSQTDETSEEVGDVSSEAEDADAEGEEADVEGEEADDDDEAEVEESEDDEAEASSSDDGDEEEDLEASEHADDTETDEDEETETEVAASGDDDGDDDGGDDGGDDGSDEPVDPSEDPHANTRPGVAALFEHPDELLAAARRTRNSGYEDFDAFSPFPIHGMDEAMGLGRSWIPWVTFTAGLTGFLTACALQFGMMTFDWPIIIGGKPFAPWPAFVPVMFELTVLIGGVTTGVVMLKAAGCFEPAEVIDPEITNDRFALWISASDDRYDEDDAREFLESMDPVDIRTFPETS